MLLAIWLFLLAVAGADEAVVREEGVALLKRADASSAVVRTLARGDRVRVLFSVTNDSGDWCEVTAGPDTGYVRCAQLDWPGGKQRGVVVPPPPLPPTPPPAATDAARLDQLLLHNYNPFFWADRLRFDPGQRTALRQLLDSCGLPQCSAAFRAILLRQGIHDFRDFALASGALERTPQGNVITAQIELCGGRLVAFWRRFPELLTPAQKAQWESERRLASPSAGFVESNMRLLFTLK